MGRPWGLGWWRRRREESTRLAKRADELQRRSQRLRDQLQATVTDLDSWIAELRDETEGNGDTTPGVRS